VGIDGGDHAAELGVMGGEVFRAHAEELGEVDGWSIVFSAGNYPSVTWPYPTNLKTIISS
jgi:hypothetical protein